MIAARAGNYGVLYPLSQHKADFSLRDNSNSDVIDDTVDYKAVSKTLKAFIGESEFQLIEALAEESIKLIFEKFNVNYIKGRFSKPGAVTGSKEVGVIIERYREST